MTQTAPIGTLIGMVLGMATTKLTITLQEQQLDEIRALVEAGEATSVSGFVQRAVQIALNDAAGWREMLKSALEETGGPLTKKERLWADEILENGRRKKGPRKRNAA